MKQRDLLKLFNRNGWWLIREGGSHMIVTDGKEVEAIPRHKEINEQTAKAIIRRRGLK
jgi:mRNA interferase HicA